MEEDRIYGGEEEKEKEAAGAACAVVNETTLCAGGTSIETYKGGNEGPLCADWTP